MKRIILIIGLWIMCYPVLGQKQGVPHNKILIVYLSRTNNTKAVAQIIQNEVGGDLLALELETPYPEDYGAIVEQVSRENSTGFLPPLKTKVDVRAYDYIFLGFPTWGMQLPPPIKSFLHENNLSNKDVFPFNTHAGYGLGNSIDTIDRFCPKCVIHKVFSVKGGVERDGIYLDIVGLRKKEVRVLVKKWLNELNIP